MQKRVTFALSSILLLAVATLAGTPGSFRGVVVDGPESAKHDGWIFVQGKNGMLRRVEIAKATVRYDENYPQEKRRNSPRVALKAGIEVRVTATQGKDGEWHASTVDIIEPDADTDMPSTPSALTEVRTS